MKYIFILTIALFSLQSSFAQGNKKSQTLEIKTNIYCDHCNQCGSCGKKLYESIHETNAGIRKVKVVPEKNIIEITYNPKKTSPEKIRTAISKAGFDADDIPADILAYQKLDGCCKK